MTGPGGGAPALFGELCCQQLMNLSLVNDLLLLLIERLLQPTSENRPSCLCSLLAAEPGQTKTGMFKMIYPGAFVYHCRRARGECPSMMLRSLTSFVASAYATRAKL